MGVDALLVNGCNQCGFGVAMNTTELEITKVGSARGVIIPTGALRRYAFTDIAIMIETADGILLQPKTRDEAKLTWEETALEMSKSLEDWSEWDDVSADGLGSVLWDQARVAERRDAYDSKPDCR